MVCHVSGITPRHVKNRCPKLYRVGYPFLR
nr:MAG TPA: hypothetical protein [Caudoviricetes sp.]